jgi:hypothetical protein
MAALHHHHPGYVHPSPALPPSLLRFSLGGRLLAVGLVIALVWALVFWAMA